MLDEDIEQVPILSLQILTALRRKYADVVGMYMFKTIQGMHNPCWLSAYYMPRMA
jgi:hypothetical protein